MAAILSRPECVNNLLWFIVAIWYMKLQIWINTGSDSGLFPICHQAITWTNDDIFHWTFCKILKENLNRNILFFLRNTFQNVACKLVAISFRPQCVNKLLQLLIQGEKS